MGENRAPAPLLRDGAPDDAPRLVLCRCGAHFARPCRMAASQGGFGPPASTIRSAGLACPQRFRRARRAEEKRRQRQLVHRASRQPQRQRATTAARARRCQRDEADGRGPDHALFLATGISAGSGVAAPAVAVDFGRGQAAGPTLAMSQSFRGLLHGRALTIRRTRRPQKFRGANCAARTPCIFYGRDVAGRADHEQLSGLLPVRPRISRHRLNACTGSMRADANDDPHSDAVSPSHRRQPHHPQSAPPRAAAWPRRRLFPFSPHKCA